MSEKLGKGLEAIFGGNVDELFADIQKGKNNDEVEVNNICDIKIDEIRPNPHQPRKEFDEGSLNELAESIKVHGVFNPITVVKDANGYVLVMGERRLRASKLAHKTTIPAYVVDYDDKQMMELALLENTQRADLNIIEIGETYQKLIDKHNYTQDELAKRVGKSRESITNTLRLLRLPSEIQKMVVDKKLTNGHVRAILPLDEDLQLEIAKQAVDEGLSVRKVEELVKKIKNNNEEKKKNKEKSINPFYKHLAQNMQSKLGTKVDVNNKQIVIRFDGDDDLNRILELIDCLEEE